MAKEKKKTASDPGEDLEENKTQEVEASQAEAPEGETPEAEVAEAEAPQAEAPKEDVEEPAEDSSEDAQEEPIMTDEDSADDEEVIDPLEEAEKKIKETHDRLLRTAAELDNVRKRARRDVEEAVVRGRVEVLRDILPTIDSIDLALKSANPEGSAAGIIEGVEMVRKQFLVAMQRFGLQPVETAGARFDPAFHEAVAQLPSGEHAEGHVVEEMRKGYVLGDRLLRAAMVVVSAGPAADREKNDPVDEAEQSETVEPTDRAAEPAAEAVGDEGPSEEAQDE